MWNERLENHAPIVALAAAMASTLAALRDWRSSAKSLPQPTPLQRSRSALTQAVYASLGAVTSAGLLEPLSAWPWAVAAMGATVGVVVDVTAANGPRRMADLSLRYLERVRRIMRDK